MTTRDESDFEPTYRALEQAIANAPHAQRELLQATDAAHAVASEQEASLTDEQLLALKMLIGHAETILTRYFGM